MAERIRQTPEPKPDIQQMLANAFEAIRSTTPEESPDPVSRRILDPAIYGGVTPEDNKKNKPRKRQDAPAEQDVPATPPRPQPLLSDRAIRELDSIFRRADVPPTPRPATATYIQPLQAEQLPATPHQEVQPRYQSLPPENQAVPAAEYAPTNDTNSLDIESIYVPAPNTPEARAFERELTRAQTIIEEAQAQGRVPEIVVSEFSRGVIDFLRASGCGMYFVAERRSQDISIEELVARAVDEARRRDALMSRSHDRRDSFWKRHKAVKRLVGVTAIAAVPFGLFGVPYAIAKQGICPTNSTACGLLALNSKAIDLTPGVNTVMHTLEAPVKGIYWLFDHGEG